MKTTRKLITTLLAATALFAALSSSASARAFSISNQQIRAVFTPIEFIASTGDTVRCTVTVEGSFHYRTFAKTATLIGYITRAAFAEPTCTSSPTAGIRARVRSETLPWHITYVDFSGALPTARIRDQFFNGAGFNLTGIPIIGTCQYRGNVRGIVGGPAGGGINEGNATITLENGLSVRSETAFCPEGRFAGRAAITLLGTTTAIIVRLI